MQQQTTANATAQAADHFLDKENYRKLTYLFSNMHLTV